MDRQTPHVSAPPPQPVEAYLPWHPLRPRIGMARRVVMILALVALWGVIGGYAFLTNEDRVRSMAGDYLSSLLGAQVHVGAADLSIFEGLRLNNVRISVPDGDGPQSDLLDADSVIIRYNFRAILNGQLEATQIIAVDPHVRLAQDLKSGRWNYQLLNTAGWLTPAAMQPGQTAPELLLRNARVDYLEVNDGKARVAGWMAAEGRFGQGAGEAGQYEFSFKSRSSQTLGPAVEGSFDLRTGRVNATLNHFTFGPDIRAMLPAQVREWCELHELGGRLSLALDEQPDPRTGEAIFRITARLNGGECRLNENPSQTAMKLANASGDLVFTNDGISIDGLAGWLDNNGLGVNGKVGGYSPNAPLDLTFSSIGVLDVPESVPLVASLPKEVREIYQRVHPTGKATTTVRLQRVAAGGKIQCQATINVLDGGFTFREIPYPVCHAKGQILYHFDPQRGFDVVEIKGIRGNGVPGGPNQNAVLTVDGWVGPLDDRFVGGYFKVCGYDTHAEEALKHALPRPAQLAWNLLDASPDGKRSTFTATFVAVNQRQSGPGANKRRWILDTDVNLSGGQAVYAGFPYAINQLSGRLEVREGFVNLIGLQARHGPTHLRIDGRVGWDPVQSRFLPDMRLTAQDLPIDDDLIAAMPASAQRLLKKYKTAGRLDVAGRVNAGSSASAEEYDLALSLRNGSIALSSRGDAVSDVAAQFNLTPRRLTVMSASGHRGSTALSGHGWLDWSLATPTASLAAEADALNLDADLYEMVPPQARTLWDKLQPVGTTDLTLTYDNRQSDSADASDPVCPPTTQPGSGVQLTIRPRNLSVSPRLSATGRPLKLDHTNGWLTVNPGRSAQCNLTARRDNGQIEVVGTWNLADANAPWDLRISGQTIDVNDKLAGELPDGVAHLIQSLQLEGRVGFQFNRLLYNPNGPAADFDVHLDCQDTSLNVGVPLQKVAGTADIVGRVRDGSLDELSADLKAPALLMAGRLASDLAVTVEKPSGQDAVRLTDFQANVAGGQMTGQAIMSLGDSGPSRYGLDMILRDADVRQLTGLKDVNLGGSVSASLNMAGTVDDPKTRRGRGDVRVSGNSLYRIPLILGLMQVTNLSLPVSSPFDNAFARYSVQGELVSLEQINLSSKTMSMQGHGHVDFGTKQVELSFATTHPDWLSFPLVGSIWNRAQSELLKIHVKGSLQSPTVSASSLDTVTTTVDQVIHGDEGK